MVKEGGGIGELFVDLFFHADTMRLKDFTKGIMELNMQSVMSAVGVGTLYEFISKIMGIADKAAMGINTFGDMTGQSTTKMQQWNKWAEQMGVSGDLVSQTVNKLGQDIINLKLGQGNMTGWMILGIDPTKFNDLFKLLDTIREKLKGTSDEQKRLVLDQLGFSQEWMVLLKKSDEEWAQINKQYAMGKDALEKMGEFHRVNAELGQRFVDIWLTVAPAMVPVVNAVSTIAIDMETILSTGKGFWQLIKDIGTDIAKVSPLYNLYSHVALPGMIASEMANRGGSSVVNQTNTFNVTAQQSIDEVDRQYRKAMDQFHHRML